MGFSLMRPREFEEQVKRELARTQGPYNGPGPSPTVGESHTGTGEQRGDRDCRARIG